METRVIELGVASKKTQDYSGAFAWDNLAYGFWKFWHGW